MQRRFYHLLKSRLPHYLLIGGVSYLIELSVLLFLAKVLLFTPALAVAYSFWVGLVASFFLQKYIAFKSKNGDKKTIGKQAVLYGALVLFNYVFTILLVGLLADLIGLVMARTLALLLTVSWNFLLYSKVIFKHTSS